MLQLHPVMTKKKNKRKSKAAAVTATRPQGAMAMLPPALDLASQISAGAQLEAVIFEASHASLDERIDRDTLVDPPKVLVEADHRKGPRVTLEVDINLASDSHFFTGLSGDISEGGLFVSTYRNVDVGSEVDLEFSIPNGAVATRGIVRWQRDASPYGPPGIGIAFYALTSMEREIIRDFCASRAPLYYEVDQL